MRYWLSRNSTATIREQLGTQLQLGVISGELKPETRLPSVRELARQLSIHPNTVSAAYRDLQARGSVEFRKGSGIYVRRPPELKSADTLDRLIEQLFTDARKHGFQNADVRARISAHLVAKPIKRIVVAEPEPELREIIVTELRGRVGLPVSGAPIDKSLVTAVGTDAVVVSIASRAASLQALLPAGTPVHLLRPRSVAEHLQGQPRPPVEVLIGIASSSPEILRLSRTVLAAAGLDPDALEFRDARERGWRRGVSLFTFVICDVVTAKRLGNECSVRVVPAVAETSLEELRRFLAN